MASPHGTDGASIMLAVESQYVEFLRTHFSGVRTGLLDDLTHHEAHLKDPVADRAAVARLTGWLDDLAQSQLVGPAAELRHVLSSHLTVIDTYTEYERVVCEHEAFAHLLAQVPA